MLTRENQLLPEIWMIPGSVKPGLWTHHFLTQVENAWIPVSEFVSLLSLTSTRMSHQKGQQLAESDFEQLLPEAAIISTANSSKITEITSSKVLYL